MNDYDLDYLDKVIHVAMSNLYTKRDKETNTIRLVNFSFKNKAHLALLNIAQITRSVLGMNLELRADPFTYFFYNLKYKYRKYCKRAKSFKGLDVPMFIHDIQFANQNFHLFEDIYFAYYERKKK